MGKEENAGHQHFLLFPQCFLPFKRWISLIEPHLSSAKAFNLAVSWTCCHLVKNYYMRGKSRNNWYQACIPIDCMVFNVVFNNISVKSQQPVQLSMLSWSSFDQYSAQYSLSATGCFPTWQQTAVQEKIILSQWLSSILGKNIGQNGNQTSDLLFSSAQRCRLSYGAQQISSMFWPNLIDWLLT